MYILFVLFFCLKYAKKSSNKEITVLLFLGKHSFEKDGVFGSGIFSGSGSDFLFLSPDPDQDPKHWKKLTVLLGYFYYVKPEW